VILDALRALVARAVRNAVLRQLDAVGRNPELVGRPYINNLGRIEVGDEFTLSSRPIQSHFVTGPGGVLIIGRGVWLDYGTAISAYSKVTIGNGVRFGPQVIVMDSNYHGVQDRDSAGEARPIVIGDHVKVGARVTILQGTHIGEGAEIADGSVVSRVIPPYVRAGGVPARPIEPVDKSRERPS
jgi:acetyltransferase-like isoleucine patch superfamily enzyme